MTNTPPATIHLGDCIEVMRTLPENSVDAIVTDPPYGLGFMGKAWDELPPGEEWARECLRVLKPGGHLLAFGGSRTWHRLAVAVEDAGFEVRDSIAWLYGSGFPKSLDVSKAIDKAAPRVGMPAGFAAHIKERREALGLTQKDVAAHFPSKSGGLTGCVWNWENGANVPTSEQWKILADILGIPHGMWATLIDRVEAEREVIASRVTGAAMSRKASSVTLGTGGTDFGSGQNVVDITAPATPAAQQWQGWGTALKPAFEPVVVARKPLAAGTVAANVLTHGTGALNIDGSRIGGEVGRWPANVVLDESQAAALDEQSGVSSVASKRGPRTGIWRMDGCGSLEELHELAQRNERTPNGRDATTTLARFLDADRDNVRGHADTGGASRFFYVAKAPTRERPKVDGVAHPTVKPLALMRWLVRLVTPPGGTVLEPFAGSGTTVEACALEGFACIAIEREPDYLPLIQARLARVEAAQPEPVGPSLFDIESTAGPRT